MIVLTWDWPRPSLLSPVYRGYLEVWRRATYGCVGEESRHLSGLSKTADPCGYPGHQEESGSAADEDENEETKRGCD